MAKMSELGHCYADLLTAGIHSENGRKLSTENGDRLCMKKYKTEFSLVKRIGLREMSTLSV